MTPPYDSFERVCDRCRGVAFHAGGSAIGQLGFCLIKRRFQSRINGLQNVDAVPVDEWRVMLLIIEYESIGLACIAAHWGLDSTSRRR